MESASTGGLNLGRITSSVFLILRGRVGPVSVVWRRLNQWMTRSQRADGHGSEYQLSLSSLRGRAESCLRLNVRWFWIGLPIQAIWLWCDTLRFQWVVGLGSDYQLSSFILRDRNGSCVGIVGRVVLFWSTDSSCPVLMRRWAKRWRERFQRVVSMGWITVSARYILRGQA
ncbi:hypothetical protein BJ165DRAFT_679661 [Panaeolus papilionaceus]|nr:hypothetical protein BJ165DRAFT_679661 [Panaeolus papilionaceus]